MMDVLEIHHHHPLHRVLPSSTNLITCAPTLKSVPSIPTFSTSLEAPVASWCLIFEENGRLESSLFQRRSTRDRAMDSRAILTIRMFSPSDLIPKSSTSAIQECFLVMLLLLHQH